LTRLHEKDQLTSFHHIDDCKLNVSHYGVDNRFNVQLGKDRGCSTRQIWWCVVYISPFMLEDVWLYIVASGKHGNHCS